MVTRFRLTETEFTAFDKRTFTSLLKYLFLFAVWSHIAAAEAIVKEYEALLLQH